MSNLVKINQELNSSEFLEKFSKSNAFGLSVAREVAFAIQHLEKNQYLQTASPESIRNCVLNVALTGLTLNPVLNQAYLVPRKVKDVVTCVLDPSYQGLITKMINSGAAQKVISQVVHANDDFDFDDSTEMMLKPHKKWYMLGKPESGAEIGAYAGILDKNGQYQYKFIPIHRINQIMALSESYKAGKKNNFKSIWEGEHREEMIKKTAVKYLWKYLPKTEDLDLIGQIIAESNFAHEVSDTEVTSSGAEIRVDRGAEARSNANVNTGRVPTPRSENKKPEDAQVVADEVAEDDVLDAAIASIKDNLEVEPGKERSLPMAKAVGEVLESIKWSVSGFNDFIAKKSKYMTAKNFFAKASTDEIAHAMIAYNNTLKQVENVVQQG